MLEELEEKSRVKYLRKVDTGVMPKEERGAFIYLCTGIEQVCEVVYVIHQKTKHLKMPT